ncbi:hypothetical protein P4493_33080 [Bacillus thuringiensis]|uniref:Pesticidal crystal protein cry20Aa n=1 Tax=Bacillus thuringiensis subsp. israelensis TaxID=1430 RepID=A0AAX3I0N6_BACTI|nr:hypothetical protein [Bacillus thuringiensis]MEC3434140.1 hypothetical protein [Bacillus cereus]MCC4014674.1 hypothetical protein [Bacillus thuringiensis]MEB4832128.1 hypothetical protein [Bacillus thuringiensis]MEC2375214.1 hypothetical protein [Bacillus thuringiensis]MEC2591149.1 hypothetical protein [Bacillus thuringiensis]
MQKRQFLHLNEGDCIYVYSGGNLEAQGRYIHVVEDKNELFLYWRKHNGNEVYTNLNGISVETMNENTAYLQNTRETCERGYNDNYNQNTSSTYEQNYNNNYEKGYNNYDQSARNLYNQNYSNYDPNASDMYDQSYNNDYNQNASNMDQQEYKNNYNQNSSCACNQGYNSNYPK